MSTTKRNPRIRNPYNRNSNDEDNERNKKPSKTVPGQAMTVPQMLGRFASGLPINGQQVPVYNGEEFLPDVKTLDLADLQALREATNENVMKIQAELQKKQKEETEKKTLAEQKKYRDKLRAEIEQELKQRNNTIQKSIYDREQGGEE